MIEKTKSFLQCCKHDLLLRDVLFCAIETAQDKLLLLNNSLKAARTTIRSKFLTGQKDKLWKGTVVKIVWDQNINPFCTWPGFILVTTQTPWELLLVIRCMPSQEAVLGRRCLYPSTPLFTLSVGEASGLKEEHSSGWCKSGLYLWTKDLGFKRAVYNSKCYTWKQNYFFLSIFFSEKLLYLCKQIWGWRAKQNHPLENVTFTMSFCNKHSALFKYKTGSNTLRGIGLQVVSLESESAWVQNELSIYS